MTNREKYAEQILKIACKGESIAVIKETNKMVPCNEAKCNECLFRECVGCDDAIIQWCQSMLVPLSIGRKYRLMRRFWSEIKKMAHG